MSTDLAIRLGNAAPLVRHALSGPTMGTRYSAVFFAPEGTDTEALAAGLFEAVDRVDRQMSTWKADSDLNRLNAAPVGNWVAIPRELTIVLAASLRIGRASNGAFDIGVGDLVAAWGFGSVGPKPDVSRIAGLAGQLRPAATKTLELDEVGRRARKHAPLSLDLSGIAKGYGVDEMARVMEAFAVPSWLVGIDGEMRAKGTEARRFAMGCRAGTSGTGYPRCDGSDRTDRYGRRHLWQLPPLGRDWTAISCRTR